MLSTIFAEINMRIHRYLFAALLLTCAATAQQLSQATVDAISKAKESNAQRRFSDTVKTLQSLPKDELKKCFQCNIELALAENNLGQTKIALETSSRSVALANTPLQKSMAHRVKGSKLLSGASEDSKLLTSAEDEFRQSIAADPQATMSRFLLGLTLLKEKRDDEGKQTLGEFMKLEPQNSDLAKYAQKLIAQPRRARERFAPEFEVTTAQGEHFTSAELAGRVVVLDFWATWCPPCRESVPELKDLSRKYANKKFTIISISNDDDQQKWHDYIAKNKMTWPQFYDDGKKVSTLFNVHAFPTYMIIDGDGAIVKELTGLDPTKSVAARLKDTLHQMKELE
jgi:thiol-disulfide isomerase/thioredoxin